MPREAGVPNKNKRGLKAQLKQQYGDDFDVILMMGQNCKTLHDIAKDHIGDKITMDLEAKELINASNSAQAANSALEKLAQFIEPKLKAIEARVDVVAHENWVDELDE